MKNLLMLLPVIHLSLGGLHGATISNGETLLATGTRTTSGTLLENLNYWWFAFGHSNGSNRLDPGFFRSIQILPGDAGKFFTVDSGAYFAEFSSIITNGTDDVIISEEHSHVTDPRVGTYSIGVRLVRNESEGMVLDYHVPQSGPDLAGYTISKVQMEVVSINTRDSGSPSNPRIYGSCEVEFSVFGAQVPEPSLGIIGTIALCYTIKRRRR